MRNENEFVTDVSRRKFMQILGAAGFTTAVAAGITVPFSEKQVREAANAAAATGDDNAEHRWVMIIDLKKCIGCQYCIFACQAVNNVEDELRWNVYAPDETETGQNFHMTKPCLHCQEPPCADVCPTGATYQRGDGLVVMDYDRCIGCRYCMVACPYDVRRFNYNPVDRDAPANDLIPEWGSPEVERRPRGVVEKCSFCIQRIDRALENDLTPGVDHAVTPACCNICPVGARIFGDLFDPESEVAHIVNNTPTFRLREELGTLPNVYYVPAEGMVGA